LKIFEFSNTVITSVLNELNEAEEFIKIAVFQIHLDSLFDLLENKIRDGVDVEILTLPHDSINETLRDEVVLRLNALQEAGATINFCKWNVGDPERTTTAIGKWYSFHGKFIVTEKCAIVLSANFTRINELDACLIIKNEQNVITNFSQKYDELLALFVTENNGQDGNIHQQIINTNLPNVNSVFDLPRVIQTTTHRNNWIKQYPVALCPDDIEIDETLCLVPFDIKGRKIYEKLLNDAEEFIFVSAESFTDPEFGLFLRNLKASKQIQVKLLTGATSMDFSDRIQKMYRELLAEDIQLYTIEEDLHAKLLITDKHLLLGSINLNKMNLGFNISNNYWRGNTETFFITTNNALILDAKTKFDTQLTRSIQMERKLAEKINKETANTLNKIFNIRARREVKELFSRFVLIKEIEVKKDAKKLAKTIQKLMQHYRVGIANKDIFFMAVILFHLQERKHTLAEINNKITKVDTIDNLTVLLERLSDSEFIEIEEDFYKINIDALF